MALVDVTLDCDFALAPFSGWPEAVSRRSGALSFLLSRLFAWQARRKTVRMLNRLDDATLKDLAISPRDIEWLVYGSGEGRIRAYDPDWWRKP